MTAPLLPKNPHLPVMRRNLDMNARFQSSPTGRPRQPEAVIGKFPKLTKTLRAEVLATMLAGDDMSGVESVFANGSTKLATVMRALTRRYRWPIEREEFATNTADGQVVWVSMYTMPATAIAGAFDLGAAAWIEEVRTAREKRRPALRAALGRKGLHFKCDHQSNPSEPAKSREGRP